MPAACRQGKIKVFFLGVGLDPLSWKPEILTACIFEGRTFDKIFKGMVTDKVDEGTGGFLLAGRKRKGVRDRAGSVMPGRRPGRRPRQLGLPGAGAGSAIAALCCQP
jgi:hypothetical protein